LQTITGLRLKRDRRGVSNIIVVVLSLVIIIAITSNVVLWSYQMNQLDWEKIKEAVKISNSTRIIAYSPWFVVQGEYTVKDGSHVNGSYEDTQVANDGRWETYEEGEETPNYRLGVNGTFTLDLSSYPLWSVSTVEIQLRYKASDAGENWYLKAYNWTANAFSDSGFNSTTGHTPTREWDNYAVNLTDQWRSYVQDDGTMRVEFCDEGNDAARTTVDIDFLGVRIVASGTRFTFKNEGALTSHLVSLWIINSTNHQRYDINVIVNSGETLNYTRADISLPSGQYTVKVVTERGNTAVYSGS
jgi:Ni,Fe-hydrogenase I large subunit